MQSDLKQIYKELGEETEISELQYKDIGTFIFQEAYQMLRNPTSLIIKLKGVGSWHLRKKRMEIVVGNYVDNIIDENTAPSTAETYRERKAQFELFSARLMEYEDYLNMKKDVREKRKQTQVLLEPNKREDGRFKSS